LGGFTTKQKAEQQLMNELGPHIHILKQSPEFAECIIKIITQQFTSNIKKSEANFIKKMKLTVNHYLFAELDRECLDEFLYAM